MDVTKWCRAKQKEREFDVLKLGMVLGLYMPVVSLPRIIFVQISDCRHAPHMHGKVMSQVG